MSNSKKLNSRVLPQEYVEEALGYVCYERTYHYLFTQVYQLESYPLLYLDRFVGWTFNTSGEPFLPLVNGLEEFLNNYIRQVHLVEVTEVIELLYKLFAQNNFVSLTMEMKHLDKSTYYTTVLIEDINDEQIVYTHINEANQTTRRCMNLETFKTKLYIDNNLVELSAYEYSEVLNRLKNNNIIENIKFIFLNLYGLKINEEGIEKNSIRIPCSQSGLHDLKKFIEEHTSRFLTASITKIDQQILSKQIKSKIHPLVQLVKYIIHSKIHITKEISSILEFQVYNINDCLNKLQFFSSVVVKKPGQKSLDLYLKSLDKLILNISHLQESLLVVLRALIEGDNYEK
ncbi:hypothetical protein BK131_16935 [Paenibacillus amylolyticus]|uniref:Uncharacterized protein n=1 Tax=Paenibacillus amylolyticus TaxID=1451 RepID=A0A1R1BSW7_PAEAM|nr:hypothetical protein [Paenibacillus amylolyticus]OMF12924.1 hypothetical protein BK131_16935 [Paenibacillus amylolyticus]